MILDTAVLLICLICAMGAVALSVVGGILFAGGIALVPALVRVIPGVRPPPEPVVVQLASRMNQ